MKNTWIFGDVHGCLSKLKQCIESVDIKEGDRLIGLGDYLDRGEDSYGVIEYLLKLKEKYECIFIKGNHDDCWFNDMKSGKIENGQLWKQGALKTYQSYIDAGVNPEVHFDFFNSLVNYYIDENMNLFVHGGFNRHEFIEEQHEPTIFYWDRDLLASARSYCSMKNNEYKFKIKGSVKGKLKEIFLGHTPTQYFDSNTPLNFANIWLLDTGAGKFKENGLVTIMNLETKEFKQY
jgi:serine/threonine protein phosphatase 1